ncbi:sulfotransferase [Halomicronema sp. CCY15110]|uniref:sulfotransferase family protein n=1 Tax=Halomicronema sp. CCY15110 TaxID=2767773 RepID=UPI00195276B4|nr:sulfotransferase [Halomicronema sp. CCY15110]
MRKKIVIIIGAMKCGTTSLFHYLAQHPLIIPSKNKEPHFFSEDAVYQRGLDWYESLWLGNLEEGIGIEASTTYTMNPKYPQVIQRIVEAQDDYDFKFIYILRDPISRLQSHMRHLIAGGHVGHTELVDDYIWYSEYARQLTLFSDAFGRNKIHVMLLEDLKENPDEEVQNIYEFLELPQSPIDHSIILNSQNTLNINPFVRKIYESGLVKSLAQKMFSPQVRQLMYKPLARRETIKAHLTNEQCRIYLSRLSHDLIQLREDYDVPIEKWDLSIPELIS